MRFNCPIKCLNHLFLAHCPPELSLLKALIGGYSLALFVTVPSAANAFRSTSPSVAREFNESVRLLKKFRIKSMSVRDKTGVPARVEKVVAGTAGEVAVRTVDTAGACLDHHHVNRNNSHLTSSSPITQKCHARTLEYEIRTPLYKIHFSTELIY